MAKQWVTVRGSFVADLAFRVDRLPAWGETLMGPSFQIGPGAGDAFNGSFAVALSEGRDLVEAVRFGWATAGISVTRSGTAPSMPKRTEIDALLKYTSKHSPV